MSHAHIKAAIEHLKNAHDALKEHMGDNEDEETTPDDEAQEGESSGSPFGGLYNEKDEGAKSLPSKGSSKVNLMIAMLKKKK